MNRFSSLLLIALVLAPTASADALKKDRVPAGARWVAHLDVEALKGSKLYAVIHEESAKNGSNEIDEGLAQFRMFAGLDPTTDFKSVTIYSTANTEKSCVALLSGNARIDTALDKLKTMPNYHTTMVGSNALHTWGGEHDTWYGYVFRKDGTEERVVIASQDTDELVRGLSVLQGTGENLVGARQPAINAGPASGSIFFAAAGEGLNELGEIEPVSAVAKLAKTIVLDVGEDRGDLYVHVALDARKPEDAQRIQQVLQGAVALAGLVGDEEHAEARAKVQRLVEALRLTVSNTRVDADFRYEVKALIEDLKSLEELGDKRGGSDQAAKSERKQRKKYHPKPEEVVK